MSRILPLADLRPPRGTGGLGAPAVEGDDVAAGATVADARGRRLHDLRISVTDRCNFRCVYCMPKDVFGRDYPFLPHAALLTFEEIARVARAFTGLGVGKIRLTGGEPLLRKNLERLVAMLATMPVDLTLTTNGALLARKARPLADAGLKRVTVSLDALDDATFRAMGDTDTPVAQVLDGIDAASRAGLAPVKINAVIKRGVNEHAIVDLARRFRGTGHIVRFIEYMDVGATNGWRMDDVVPAAEILERVASVFPIEPADPNYAGEVALRWRYRDGAGEIGVIASVTQAFCRDCTRMRLSTDGKLYTCLFATEGHDLRELVRGGADDATLARAIAAVWRRRDDRYSEVRTAATPRERRIEMSYIGG
ncbi:GTP 3',8-cyclase [Burkholderiales bacterium]|nr:GTP 3',8-cyclase [Burkholderiales bacterium]